MTLDAVDVLVEAKLWIDKGWCQEHFGTTATGNVALCPATADRVCAMGAGPSAGEIRGLRGR